jgi:hypothetical protein
MNRLDKKQIFIGTILGIILSILTLILLTRNIQPLSAQQTTQKYTTFKTQNLGFKFVNLSGQYLPIFAQTPTSGSPANQVATKEYVDMKIGGGGSGLFLTIERQGRGNSGIVLCPNPFSQQAISAQYAGWDVGAKEDAWYGVWPVYRYVDPDTNIPLHFNYPIGAYFIRTGGYWLSCADIGNNPSAVIKAVGPDFEDMSGYLPKLVRTAIGGGDKIDDEDLWNLFKLDYISSFSPNYYVSLGDFNGQTSLPRLSCDRDPNRKECGDFVYNQSINNTYAQDKYTSYGYPRYELYKRMDIKTYGYSDGINPKKLKWIEKEFSWNGIRSWPTQAGGFSLEKGEKILGVRIEGYSDDGGICFVEITRVPPDYGGEIIASFASTRQSYVTSSAGYKLDRDRYRNTVYMYNRNAGSMKTCWFDIKSILGKSANQGPTNYSEACLHSNIASDFRPGPDVRYYITVYGANADGPRGESWWCKVGVLVEQP